MHPNKCDDGTIAGGFGAPESRRTVRADALLPASLLPEQEC